MRKYKNKASRIVIGLTAASMLLAACSTVDKHKSDPGSQQQEAGISTAADEQDNTAETKPSEGAGITEDASVEGTDADTAANAGTDVATDKASAENATEADVGKPTEPIASLPEKDIYLYPEKQNSDAGVLLQIGEHKQHFDWLYDTPRMVMPQLQLSDYDGDKKEELAAVTYVGSGTGLSIYELHMLEGIGDEAPYLDHVFAEKDYLAQLSQALAFKKVMKDGVLYGQITIGGQKYEVSLADFQKGYGEEKIADKLGFGAIIQFQAEQGKLAFTAAVGLFIDGVAEPQYIGSVEANVTYKSGKFKLDQFRFTDEV
ncbi:hypothetical protein [Paenibacillus kobensis]|uniref:hypothetical protein n=1 Tax=Paenibacillus kobensis TaxID=59841 RepID=UPI000FDA21E5|nr:hypothetical protein [Paenibacillus kobensis]